MILTRLRKTDGHDLDEITRCEFLWTFVVQVNVDEISQVMYSVDFCECTKLRQHKHTLWYTFDADQLIDVKKYILAVEKHILTDVSVLQRILYVN